MNRVTVVIVVALVLCSAVGVAVGPVTVAADDDDQVVEQDDENDDSDDPPPGLGSVELIAAAESTSLDDLRETGAVSGSTVYIDVDETGDAEVIMQVAFFLEEPDEADEFNSIEGDEEALEDWELSYVSRMTETAEATDHHNTADIRDSEISTDRVNWDGVDGEHGVVTVSFTWDNFAQEHDDDGLVVTEPFASQYDAPESLVLVGPDGWESVSATPSPYAEYENVMTWPDAGELDGFDVWIAENPDEVSPDDEDDDGDGFGIGMPPLWVLIGASLIGGIVIGGLVVWKVVSHVQNNSDVQN